MASRFLILSVLSLFFFLLAVSSAPTSEYYKGDNVFDVRNYGARGDGKTDNAIAISKAWNDACQWSGGSSTVYIPLGTFYLSQVTFAGPCKSYITFIITGTLTAPRDPDVIKQEAWIEFRYVDNLTVTGGGLLDGQGDYSWSLNDCNKNPKCRTLAINIGFAFVRSSRINGLNSINSKMGHFNLFAVEDFNITGVTITAPGDSPNTDGIKIGRSKDMHLYNVTIATGDDCIAILDGTTNLDISDVRCGPGHGISVGSLGRYKDEKNVEGLTVRNSIINGTTDGLRIKTYAKSVSAISVSNFLYDNIQMVNVRNPIVIDQQYCPNGQCDSPGKYESHVQIRDVTYNKIWGTSTSQAALNMQCSKTFPCQGVELSNINLMYNGGDGSAMALCENVGGSVRGKIVPAGCHI
ncbi:glycoside hydrolase family 28 protein / polygalacturonase (pectinase) family protein [Raphanus sativus]|uniref:Exopolygalacturonase-like n=1 Tax=Raphanus sativus TaxID=3726 RepID=A0A6J0MTW8_RAPSA|nr:exopolygalacturonase-like [Raphanus sativus]KAJ4907190.1 glycoside hydrolase family 28 protein / polygalacturonase (pectinase) family protein [Raphanus sativus]